MLHLIFYYQEVDSRSFEFYDIRVLDVEAAANTASAAVFGNLFLHHYNPPYVDDALEELYREATPAAGRKTPLQLSVASRSEF